MTKRIFFANFCSAILASLLCSIVLTLVTYNHFLDLEAEKMESQTLFAAQAVEKLGLDYFQDLNPNYYRITWIDSSGDVLFDTHGDAGDMENHNDRTEVEEAFATGFGTSTRESETIFEELIYFAQRLDDGTVLRLSGYRNTLLSFFLSILQPLSILFLLCAWLTAILAYYLSQSIIRPLTALNLENPHDNSEVYDEIAPLLTRIQRQYLKIDNQLNEMSRKQEEFDIITRNMEEGLILLNQDSQILSINESAAQLFVADKVECLGKSILMLHRSVDMQQLLEKALLGEHTEGMLAMDNQMYQINASPIIQEGQVSGVAVLLLNATEKSEAEQIRREFTANVSHELKTPLHSISGCAELLSHNLVQGNDIPQFAFQIYNEAQRLIRLVDEIISLSRLDEGAEDLATEEVDLASVAKEVAFHLEDMANNAGLSLSVEGNSAKMMGSYTLLSGLLRNLCENSIKYNQPNGTVSIIVEDKEEYVRLQVNDTGIGISEKDKQLIFQRFYRVDKSRSKEIGGTGLGLSIVKHTVALHQGKLTMESSLNEGTSIQIDFPKKKF